LRHRPLLLHRARYYDPKIGSFPNEDPVGFRAGNNFFTYVANDPVNFVDPTGLSASGPGRGLGDLCRFFAGRSNSTHVEDSVTRDLASGPTMAHIRSQYQAAGCKSDTYCGNFNFSEFGRTTTVVGHTVGGFCARVTNLGNGRALVQAQNTWGRESGTGSQVPLVQTIAGTAAFNGKP
jgi:uncharacterized protein RhaS with RHS repeats